MSHSQMRKLVKFIRKKLKQKPWQWQSSLTDPRLPKGRRWPLFSLLNAIYLGLLTRCLTLREAEEMTEKISPDFAKALGIDRRVPDTTMYDLLVRLNPKEFRPLLHQQIKDELRAKHIKPDLLPIGVIALDGKTIATGKVGFHPQAQTSHTRTGEPYGNLRAIRGVLISCSTQLCLDQGIIPAHTNEMGYLGTYWKELLSFYGRTGLFEAVSLDSGYTSLANANLINDSGYAYVMGLKENQPELLREARRLFSGVYDEKEKRLLIEPEAQSEWEPYQGKLIRRSLFRSQEMAGYLEWSHLKQVWLVVQETKDKEGRIEVENRYFITNLLWKRLPARQCLKLVRLHWRIENSCNWTIDTQWKEDSKAWSGEGNAVEVLSWMRLMAYNLCQMVREGALKEEGREKKSWKGVFECIKWYFWVGRPGMRLEEEIVFVGR